MAVTVRVPAAIAGFLNAETPDAWLDEASGRLSELLLDHANCELKAASTAMGFLYRYPERTNLAQCMSRRDTRAGCALRCDRMSRINCWTCCWLAR